jgi:hypothetical protein
MQLLFERGYSIFFFSDVDFTMLFSKTSVSQGTKVCFYVAYVLYTQLNQEGQFLNKRHFSTILLILSRCKKTLHFNKLYFTLLYSIQFSQEVYADGNDFRHISLIFVNIYIAQFVSKEICFTALKTAKIKYKLHYTMAVNNPDCTDHVLWSVVHVCKNISYNCKIILLWYTDILINDEVEIRRKW